jgi:hypothetical protein
VEDLVRYLDDLYSQLTANSAPENKGELMPGDCAGPLKEELMVISAPSARGKDLPQASGPFGGKAMTDLAMKQAQMKRRIEKREKTAATNLRPMGRGRPRLAERRYRSRCFTGIGKRPENCGNIRTEAYSGSEEYRRRLCARKDFLSAQPVIKDEFISNLPTGESSPPQGEPFTYYLFATLITQHQGKRAIREIKTKYRARLGTTVAKRARGTSCWLHGMAGEN